MSATRPVFGSRPSGRPQWLAVITAVLALLVAACGDDDVDVADTTSTPPTAVTTTTTPPTTSTTSTTSTTTIPMAAETTLVYFGWNEKVGAAGRDGGLDVTEALRELLEGPDDFEVEIGMGTEIPDGTNLLDVEMDGTTAIVDLSGAFESGGGSLSMQVRLAQVVFTVTQFPEIDDVDIRLDGNDVEFIGGEGLESVALDRTDFANVTPLILVESPTPGATISSPLTVEGYANTFEATVRYDITDGDGLIVADGFTTGTAGNGFWGPFEFTTEFEPQSSGFGAVIVFQDDADTGQPRDIYEVPVRVVAAE